MTPQLALDANSKKVLQIFMNLKKNGCVIGNYRQCLKSKMFKLENDITLLFVDYISPLKHEVWMMGQCIKFPLLAPKVICDDKLELK
jgi:hypothetical protein